MRTDVYAAIQDAAEEVKQSGEKLNPEDQRLVDKMVLEGKRNGLALPEAEREKLKSLKQELNKLQIEFSKNFNEEDGHVTFTLEELDGLPADVVSGFPKRTNEDGKEVYDVPFKSTDIFPVVRVLPHVVMLVADAVRSSSTRRGLSLVNLLRKPSNCDLPTTHRY
jgi:Zn-dependent oligopeptidase